MESDNINQGECNVRLFGNLKALCMCVMWSDAVTAEAPDKLDAPVDALQGQKERVNKTQRS